MPAICVRRIALSRGARCRRRRAAPDRGTWRPSSSSRACSAVRLVCIEPMSGRSSPISEKFVNVAAPQVLQHDRLDVFVQRCGEPRQVPRRFADVLHLAVSAVRVGGVQGAAAAAAAVHPGAEVAALERHRRGARPDRTGTRPDPCGCRCLSAVPSRRGRPPCRDAHVVRRTPGGPAWRAAWGRSTRRRGWWSSLARSSPGRSTAVTPRLARRRRLYAPRWLRVPAVRRAGCSRMCGDRRRPICRRRRAARWRGGAAHPCARTLAAPPSRGFGPSSGPALVDRSRSPELTVRIWTLPASAMSISRSRSFIERYSRSTCQQISAPNSPAFIASSMASKPGRSWPLNADRSLSS